MPEHCPETGSGFIMGGPVWSEPLHDVQFVEAVLEEIKVHAKKQSLDALHEDSRLDFSGNQ